MNGATLPLYRGGKSDKHQGQFFLHNSSSPVSTINAILRYTKTVIADPKTRNVFFFLCLNLSFTFVEAIYGIWTNSLGLTSDAVHMLFDSTALILSLAASVIVKWGPNDKFTYGYGRVETLTGFVNGVALCLAGIGIIWEAVERLLDPPEIKTESLLVVSVLGFLVNLVGIFAFEHGHTHGHDHSHDHSNGHTHHGHSHSQHDHDHHQHHHHDNHSHTHHGYHDNSHGRNPLMQGMFLHVLADTLGSVGVITSSILIQLYGWKWADPVCSLFIAIMILMSVWPLLISSGLLLLQRVPHGYEYKLCSGKYIGTIKVQASEQGSEQKIRMLVTQAMQEMGITSSVIQVDKPDPNTVQLY
ncbi:hypothetical protein SeMB42_g07398 [Synchytrium endobioticum]|uniref:Cation efflux protein transmembrane domain-containing protein n=1 Tax=Synchytrium endobioticum TaxID=286115 RepID=A0A507C7I6_9FUNG|nr:hypothetical protein SeMB42_g07398 [Synchytrium endobioticum]